MIDTMQSSPEKPYYDGCNNWKLLWKTEATIILPAIGDNFLIDLLNFIAAGMNNNNNNNNNNNKNKNNNNNDDDGGGYY